MADKYPGWSPYNYTVDNPVKFIDSEGRDVYSFSIAYGRGFHEIGGGLSLSFAWDDQGSAGILFSGGGGVGEGISGGSGAYTHYKSIKSIFDLEGVGISSGLSYGPLGVEFNGDVKSPTWIFGNYGASIYSMVTYSRFLAKGSANDYREVIDHYLSGDNISFNSSNFSFDIYDKGGNLIKTIYLNQTEETKPKSNSGEFPEQKKNEESPNFNFTSPSDNTSVRAPALYYDPISGKEIR